MRLANDTMAQSNPMSDSMSNPMSDPMSDTMSNSNSSGVDGLPAVDYFSDVALGIVSVVVDGLGAAVGEGDGVGSLPGGGAVVRLRGREAGAGVVVRHRVLVAVGRDLVGVDLVNTVAYSVSNTVANTVSNTVTNNTVAKTIANTGTDAVANTVTNNTMTKTMANTADQSMSNTTNKPVSNTTNKPVSQTSLDDLGLSCVESQERETE